LGIAFEAATQREVARKLGRNRRDVTVPIDDREVSRTRRERDEVPERHADLPGSGDGHVVEQHDRGQHGAVGRCDHAPIHGAERRRGAAMLHRYVAKLRETGPVEPQTDPRAGGHRISLEAEARAAGRDDQSARMDFAEGQPGFGPEEHATLRRNRQDRGVRASDGQESLDHVRRVRDEPRLVRDDRA
jgi:hypothetical protein